MQAGLVVSPEKLAPLAYIDGVATLQRLRLINTGSAALLVSLRIEVGAQSTLRRSSVALQCGFQASNDCELTSEVAAAGDTNELFGAAELV